jgi:hypothetical protein
MGNITLSELFSRILAACGAVTIMVAAGAAIRKVFNPAFRTKQEVEQLKKCNEDTIKLLEEISETNKLLCSSMMVLLDHSITGNGIDEIKKVKSKLVNYLAEK